MLYFYSLYLYYVATVLAIYVVLKDVLQQGSHHTLA